MQQLLRLQDRLLAFLSLLGGIATVTLMVHVAVDILLRNLANAPIPATYEIATHYYMVSLAFLPLAALERSGGMIQVEVLDTVLGRHGVHLSNLFNAALSALVYATLTYVTWLEAMNAMSKGRFVFANTVHVLTWPAYWIPPLGFAVAMLVAILRLFTLRKSAPKQEAAA